MIICIICGSFKTKHRDIRRMASIREVYSAFVHSILPLTCINMVRVYAEYDIV